MAFRSFERILEADPRFHALGTVRHGRFQPIELADHHGIVSKFELTGSAPDPVRNAFDRARSVFLYAWFDYDLFVVAEGQALSALELALQLRLEVDPAGSGTGLGRLIKLARSRGILPAAQSEPFQMDPFDALRHLRNELAHGTAEVHSPAMAANVVAACGSAIDGIFP